MSPPASSVARQPPRRWRCCAASFTSISRRWCAISNGWAISCAAISAPLLPPAARSPTCSVRASRTLLLSLFAFAIYLVLALVPAIIQAVNRGKTIDNVISVITLVLLSLPDFLLATILLFVFAVAVPVLPALATISETSTWREMLRAMVLPAVTLAIMMAVYAIRVLRDSLIEVLRSDYVRLAELKGLRPRAVLFRHALPNAIVPALNVTALNLGFLIGGVVIVERVFSYPGFGTLLIDALQLRGYSADQGHRHDQRRRLCRCQFDRRRARRPAPTTSEDQPMTIITSNPSRLAARLDRWHATPGPFKAGAVILAAHILFAVVGAIWTPYGFAEMGAGLPLSGMSWQHPMGLDQIGRDVFSRFMHGAHIVLLLSFSGTMLGHGRRHDARPSLRIYRRLVRRDHPARRRGDDQHSLPGTGAGDDHRRRPGACRCAGAHRLRRRPRLRARITRIARAAAMEIATREYVAVAELRGEGTWSIVFREILPNAANVLLVEFSLRLGYAPILIGALGFLGFGIRRRRRNGD